MIWTAGEQSPLEFLQWINQLHDNIKFTWDWSKRTIHYLDVQIINNNGVIETDLYTRPTDLDRPVIDLSWKVAMGFCILPNPCPLLGTIFLCPAFVLLPVSLCSICSLTVRSPSAFCLGFSRFSFVHHRCLLPSWFVMSCLAFPATSCVSSLASLCTSSTFVSFVFGGPVMTSASAVFVRLLLMSWIVSRLVSASISRCSSVASPPIVAAVSSSVSGVLVVTLLQSSMAILSFIFSLLFGIPVLCAGLVGRLVTLGSAIC